MTKLQVPYFSQRDNYRDSWRTCFSSSSAMALKSVMSEAISGDDEYIETVFSIGDTTQAWVQVSALAKYGVKALFRQTGSDQDIKKNIDRGIAVPVGILHQGPEHAPSGGGHWVCVIGYNEDGFIVHDPWGYLDHKSGKYTSTDGDSVLYSYEMFDRRWTVDSTSDGWYIDISTPPVKDILDLEGFRNFFKYFNSESHQDRAIEILYENLPEKLKDENHPWILMYRGQHRIP